MAETAVQVRVAGQVQGVGFRVWTRDTARGLGLRGWVRNERDGSVAALLLGPEAQVSAMVEAMREGPPGAAVATLTPAPADPAGAGAGFEIRR